MKRKALGLLVLIAPLALYHLGGDKEPSVETPIVKPNSANYDVYLVDPAEVEKNPGLQAADHPPLALAYLSKPFAVVVRFHQLVPGQPYEVTCRVEDAEGKIVERQADDSITIQSNTPESWAYFPFIPDPAKHGGGNWKATLVASGLEKIEHSFQVQGLSGEEKEALADHEEAKIQAIHAFANFWVGVPHQKQQTYVTATAEHETNDVLKRYTLHQVAGVTIASKQTAISKADRLNGISYSGSVGFGFSTYRSYSPKTGWSDWKDLNAPENQLEAGWNRLTRKTPADPERGQQAPGMRFRIQRRDGNWVVVTDEKARFINGTRKDEESVIAARQAAAVAKARSAAAPAAILEALRAGDIGNPPPFGYPPPVVPDHVNKYMDGFLKKDDSDVHRNEIFSGEIFQPRIEFVAKISEEGASGRANLQQIAAEVQASPAALKEQQAMTIKTFQE